MKTAGKILLSPFRALWWAFAMALYWFLVIGDWIVEWLPLAVIVGFVLMGLTILIVGVAETVL